MIRLIAALFKMKKLLLIFTLLLFANNAIAGGLSTTIQTYQSPSVNSTMQTYSSPPVTQTVQSGSNTEVTVPNNSTGISQAKSEAYSSKSLANSLKNPSNLNNNYSKPLTTNTLMKTTGISYGCTAHVGNIYTSKTDCNNNCQGGTCTPLTGNTKLVCPSSKQFLNIFAEPQSTGDFVAYIRTDIGLTGSFTDSITTPPISGVCTNGFISCDPGTWHNCKYYTWGIKHKNTGNNITYNSLKACKETLGTKCDSNNKCSTNGNVYSSLSDCENSCSSPVCALTSDKMIYYVQQTTASSLGNCFAINASVGNLFWNDFDNIMTTLGGGLVGHLSSEENVAVTKSKLDQTSMSIGYYGADSGSCSAASNSNNSYNGASPNQLRQDYSAGEISGVDAEVFKQSGNPNSYYSQLTNSNYMQSNPITTTSCKISRFVKLDYSQPPITESSQSNTDAGLDDQIWVNFYWDTNKKKFFYIQSTNDFPSNNNVFSGYKNHSGCWYTESGTYHYDSGFDAFENGCSGSYSQYFGKFLGNVYANNQLNEIDTNVYPANGGYAAPVKKISVTVQATNTGCANIYWIHDFYRSTDTNKTLEARVGTTCGSGVQYPHISIKVSFTADVAKPALVTNGSCSGISQNCKLKKEEVCDYNGMNCLTTVSNYSPAGTPVFPNCTTLTDNTMGGSWNVCDDGSTINYTGSSSGVLTSGTDIYWVVKKTYTCPAPSVSAPDVSRARTVDSNVSYSGSQLNYADTLQGHTNGSITVNTGEFKKSDCIPACVVIDNTKKDSVVPDMGNPVKGTQTTGTKYVTCERTDPAAAWSCPIPAGYSLKNDCACIDGSARAISALTSADEAAHDMICSQN